MSRRTENETRLREYGRTLAQAGLEVWYNPGTYGGYLTYRDPETGARGVFQESDYEGWSHSMPIKPSRENGSSMFIGKPVQDVWSVEAAKQAASPRNHNDLVGWQDNHHDALHNPAGVPLHDTRTETLVIMVGGDGIVAGLSGLMDILPDVTVTDEEYPLGRRVKISYRVGRYDHHVVLNHLRTMIAPRRIGSTQNLTAATS